MLKALFTSCSLLICTLGYSLSANNSAFAQVTSDGTVNTEVNDDGNTAEITGGETRGDNLFHSFEDFSVKTGNEAFFNNADSISNIFSRVTGGNVSDIDGAIRANGSASLFLINPAGIVFGENASLNIGGSFYGSSASSIVFEDGEFSASDLENPPLLTINAPIGLGFRDEPGDIVNRSIAENSAGEFPGLKVLPGYNLAFIGGNINFETGLATASGGNIELGGLSEAGIVSINEDGSFSFPDDVTKADITLSDLSVVYVSGIGGGNIAINARNLNLTAGEFGSSFISTGITPKSISTEAQSGDITIDVTENITLDDSRILNQVDPGGVGNSGNITINTGSLKAINGGKVDASTFGQGNAGTVKITATGDITADGENSEGFSSGVNSQVDTDAVGNSGGVTIKTTNLALTNGGQVDASTFGQGNAGAVRITATEDITADGENSEGFSSAVSSTVDTDGIGNSGGVTISTNNLTLTNGGEVDASTFGKGDAGAVNTTATGDITVDGEDSGGIPSGVTSLVETDAVGNAGGVTISTTNLNLTKGGRVDASTFGQGDAGAVKITSTGDFTVDGEDSEGIPSGATSRVEPDAEGSSGGVTISTTNLNLTNGGRVDASTFGQGDAGAVKITATGDLTFDGETSKSLASGVTSGVEPDAVGNARGVTISTNNLTLTKGGRITASTFGQGNAGLIKITAIGDLTFDGETSGGTPSRVSSLVTSDAAGNSGGVAIKTTNLTLTNGGQIDASTFGQGNAGEVDITAIEDITIDGENSNGFASGILSNVGTNAVGNAGGIRINSGNITLTKGAFIGANTSGQGNAGSVNIAATGNITFDGKDSQGISSGVESIVGLDAEGDAGGATISTTNLNLTNGGRVDASTLSQGNAGNVTIDASESIVVTSDSTKSSRSGIYADAWIKDGNGGDINISTKQLTIANGGTIQATNFDRLGGNNTPGTGQPGNIFIQANNLDLANTARIDAATQSPTGESGKIDLQIAEDITLQGNSFISAQAFKDADGGNLNIDARFVVAFPNNGTGNDLVATAEQGTGGNINLNAEQIFGLETGEAINDEGDFIRNNNNELDVSSNVFGFDGRVNINTSDINPVQGATELPSNIVEAKQTADQTCSADSEGKATNGLAIAGRGGVSPKPDAPLDSANIIDSQGNYEQTSIPEPIETAQGKIQPARGIKFTKDGRIILTAYPTNNAGERIPEIEPNCKTELGN